MKSISVITILWAWANISICRIIFCFFLTSIHLSTISAFLFLKFSHLTSFYVLSYSLRSPISYTFIFCFSFLTYLIFLLIKKAFSTKWSGVTILLRPMKFCYSFLGKSIGFKLNSFMVLSGNAATPPLGDYYTVFD